MEFRTQDNKNMSEIAQRMQGKSEDKVISELADMIRSGQGGLFAGRMKQYVDDIDRMMPSMRSKYRGISFEVV